MAADRAGIDFAAVFHSGLPFPAPGLTPASVILGEDGDEAEANMASATTMVDERMAAARSKLGLAPVAPGLIERPFARGLNILTTFEQFEPPRLRPGRIGRRAGAVGRTLSGGSASRAAGTSLGTGWATPTPA